MAWFRAELAAYRRLVESGKREHQAQVRRRLKHWQRYPGLTGLRERVAALGGSLSIARAKAGLSVAARIPIAVPVAA